jgi:hypothetical protein
MGAFEGQFSKLAKSAGTSAVKGENSPIQNGRIRGGKGKGEAT